MSEQEPRNTQEPNAEGLNEEDFQNLKEFWKEVGTGDELDETTDISSLREQMWKQTQAALVERILPHIPFEQNIELEEKISQLESGSPERADAEFQLVQNYIAQIKEVEGTGYATTPLLSERSNYSMNCVVKSALVGTLLERNGMRIESGSVAGHVVVIAEDTIGRKIYADPNGIVGYIPAQAERQEHGSLYRFLQEDQIKLGIPYGLMHGIDPRIGFLEPMFVNLLREVLEEEVGSDSSAAEVLNNYTSLIDKTDWFAISEKLFSDQPNHETEEWDQEIDRVDEWHLASHDIATRVATEVLGNDSHTSKDRKNLMKDFVSDIIGEGKEEQSILYLQDPTTNEVPANLQETTTKTLEAFARELSSLSGPKQDLKNHLLSRFTSVFHRS